MNRALIIFCISLFINVTSCISQGKNTGIEIYIQNIPNPVLSNENSENCYCCINLSKDNLNYEPLLIESDIEDFDWEKQKISLSESGIKKISELDFSENGVHGVPTAVILNGKPIYSLMIFPFASSVACDRVFTHLSFETKEIFIHFGVGNIKKQFRYGKDPRFNSELKQYVFEKFKNN